MLIPRWVKVVAILAALAGLFVAWQAYEAHIFKQGYDKAAGEAKAREDKITADALERFNKAAGEAKAREDKLRSDLAAADAQRYEDNARHEKELNDLRARVRAGDERLRVAIDARSLPGCAPGESRPVAARPEMGERADLMPGTADDIFSIAGRVAGLVRRYDALVERYDRAREICNADPIAAPQ